MNAFIGIKYFMSIVKMPTQRNHWSKRTLLQNGVNNLMSRNRFEFIYKIFLHDMSK